MTAAPPPWVTIVIPTRDSGRWIGALLAHYAARGWHPTLLVDDRTADDTRAIARAHGSPIVEVHGFKATEAIVRRTADCVATPWALFIHDDEVPSDALFARLAGPPPPRQAQSVAIPRRWAWFEPGKPLRFGRSDHWADRAGRPGMDHGWRLFRPDQVRFTAIMHSDGFVIDRWARMPADAYYVHFEWVIRTYAQRLAKLERYDQVRAGYGSFFANLYLPETQAAGVIRFQEVGTDEFDALAAAYYACRDSGPGAIGPVDPDLVREQANADRSGLAPIAEREIALDAD